MPDVSSTAPACVDHWIVFDVHKNSLVAGVLPAQGGSPQVTRLENTDRAIRRFVGRLGDPKRLAVRPVRLPRLLRALPEGGARQTFCAIASIEFAYEAGPCGSCRQRVGARERARLRPHKEGVLMEGPATSTCAGTVEQAAAIAQLSGAS